MDLSQVRENSEVDRSHDRHGQTPTLYNSNLAAYLVECCLPSPTWTGASGIGTPWPGHDLSELRWECQGSGRSKC